MKKDSVFQTVLGMGKCFILLLILNGQFSKVVAQGTLTPPGAPAPTMKTLSQIEPRTPISSIPYTISTPGSYYVTSNLIAATNEVNGISISCGDITVDLNGFTIQPAAPGNTGAGILVMGTFTNIVVRNGTLTGWGLSGIDAWSYGYPRNMLFEKITVSGNAANGIYSEAGSIIRDCLAIGNGESGFYSQGGEISGCVARNNGTGFTAYNCSLWHCGAEYNTGTGFYLSSSRTLDCDSIFNGSYGFDCYSSGNELHSCRSMNNSNIGVFVEAGSGQNMVEDCTIANDSPYGMYTEGNGGTTIARNSFTGNPYGALIIADSNNYIEDNHVVTSSEEPGIGNGGGDLTNNVVVKNYVTGGGSGYNYYIPGNDIGPIGSAATATSPWANISH
jgi:parallel beta-helix repeat protein